MTAKRVFLIMIGTICLTVVGVFGSIYFGNLTLVNQSNKLVDSKALNEALANQEVALAKAKQNIEKYKNLEEITQTIVPRDKDQAKATREIVTLAQESGIAIKTISFPASNLGVKIAKPSGENQTQPTQETPNPISQAKPVQGINGVYSLEANIVPVGSVNYYQFISFLSKLEKNRRTAQVTSIKIDPTSSSRSNPSLTFSLTINIFLKP